MVRRILVRILLMGRNRYFGLVKIKGKLIKVDISPYESREERKEKAINNGVFTASDF